MAGKPVCFLIFLMPSPRLELRTLAGYTASSGIWRFVFPTYRRNVMTSSSPSRKAYSTTHRHFQEDPNPQQCRCENLKSGTALLLT